MLTKHLHKDRVNRAKRLILFASVLLFVSNNYAQHNLKPGYQNLNPTTIDHTPLRGNGMMFTQNKGQIVDTEGELKPDILYKGESSGTDIYIRKTGISYVMNNVNTVLREVEEQTEELEKAGKISEINEQEEKQKLMLHQILKLHRIDVEFLNCNQNVETKIADQVEGYNNYYYDHCPQGITHVNSYNEITVKNIYNNIDVKYYGNKDQGLKYDIVVNPYAAPGQIKLSWKGVEQMQINNQGHLVIRTGINEFTESLPKVYQNINGKIVDVNARYILSGTTVSFALGAWNSSYPVIIDPWISYYGGTKSENGNAVTADPSGNAIFTGFTLSFNFPVSVGAFQTTFGGNQDAFIVKMDPNGNRLFATFLGGNSSDTGNGIDTDSSGNIFITGETQSSNFPIQIFGAAYSQILSGGGAKDAFIAKFNPGGGIIWSTYYGGSLDDFGNDVCIDLSNNIIMVGETSGGTFPTLAPYQAANAGGADFFIVKFNSLGVQLWSTYYGGSLGEARPCIAYDAVGNLFMSGSTYSVNFPVLAAFQGALSGTTDLIIAKLNGGTGFPMWSTYYGGNSWETNAQVATDGLGNVYLGGATVSAVGVSSGAGVFQPAKAGAANTFDDLIVKFNAAGVRLWATYLGGTGDEELTGLECDVTNNLIVGGDTYSTNFPITSCAYQTQFAGSEDQTITTFDPNGLLICSGLLGIGTSGSPHNETSYCGGTIAVYDCFIYLVGMSQCTYPVTSGAYQTICTSPGVYHTTISQLYKNSCGGRSSSANFTTTNPTICVGQTVNYTSAVYTSCIAGAIQYSWSFAGGTPSTSTLQNPSGITYNTSGIYNVKLIVRMPCGKDSVEKTSYVVVSPCGCTLSALANPTTNATCNGGANGTATANGSAGTSPYTYSWSNGQSGATATGLSAGIYTVTVKDPSGCIYVTQTTISEPVIINFNVPTPANLCQGATASASVTSVTNGTAPYTYNWSNGQSSATATGLNIGTYFITVTDAIGCSASQPVQINPVPKTFNITSITSTPASCGGSDGTATVTAATGFFRYLWLPIGGTGPIATGLPCGTYTVIVSVGYLCTKSASVAVACTGGGTASATVQSNVSCSGGNNGSATASITGGVPNYTYTWSNGATTQTVNGLFQGTYTVTVKDGSGCSSTSTVAIISPPALTGQFTKGSANCIECGCKEWIMTTGSGGTSPYTYSWPGGHVNRYKNHLCPGAYTINIKDKNGCSINVSLTTP